MAWYTYAHKAAFDPNTQDVAPVGSVGQVYAVSDNAFSSPVPTYDLTGIPVELVAGEHGFLPQFQVEDQVELKWVSGEYVFHLNTTTPLFGPPGETGADGSNVVPTAEAVASEVATPGAPANEILRSTYADKNTNKVTLGSGALATLPEDYDIGTTGTVIAIGKDAMANMSEVKKSIAIGSGAQAEGTRSRDNVAIGESALRRVQSGSADYSQADMSGTRNIGIGGNAGHFLTSGYSHTIIGRNAGHCIEGGTGLTAIGANANGGYAPVGLTGSIENWAKWGVGTNRVRTTAVGSEAANSNTASNVVAVGGDALKSNKKSDNNVAVGAQALMALDAGTGYNGGTYAALSRTGTYTHDGNTLTLSITGHGLAVGDIAYIRLLDGDSTTFASDAALAYVTAVPDANKFTVTHPVSRAASGAASLLGKETAAQQPLNADNTAVGSSAGLALKTGAGNAMVGTRTLEAATNVSQTATLGKQALQLAVTAANSVAVGFYAAGNMSADASQVVAIGASALRNKVDGTSLTEAWTNIIGIGYDSRVSGANQAQIGNSSVTTYTYGAVQNRSDERDKADIRDTTLGLDFINKLRPVDYKWDYRDDYDGKERDGSKKRNRYHHGVIAQQVEQVVEETGIDFGGLQDHKVNGGADVYSVGYEEFIAPLIKAVQELSAEVADLRAQLSAGS